MTTPTTRSFSWIGLLASALVPAQEPKLSDPAALDRDVRTEVRGVLDRAYAQKQQPDLEAWWTALAGSDDAARAHAGACLHALLVLVNEDAAQGRTPGREGMKLYSGPQDFAGEVRWRVAEGFGEATWLDDGRAAQAAALWLWHYSPRVDERTNAVDALVRIRTPAADGVVREAVQKAHPTFRVLAMALEAAGRRDLRDLAPAAAALRDHYHADVRTAAIAAAKALGRTDEPPAVDPDRMTPLLAKWLALAANLVVEPIPADAAWSKVTLAADPESGRKAPEVVEGFVLAANGGRPQRLLRAWGSVWPLDEGKAEVVAGSLAAYGESLLALRARYDGASMDEQMRIEMQLGISKFAHASGQRWVGSGAEILTAAWLHQRGDDALACRIVLPLLRGAADEEQFFGGVLGEVAAECDEAMLEAFTMARDYARAIELAKKLARPECAFWWHRQRAVELAEQLPRRLADFRELVLPAPDEWTKQKASMPQRAQVEFLVARLRLLNCMQMSIPGGIDYGDTQYREPLAGFDWRAKTQPVTVVNPFVELLQTNLDPAEMELLIPLLEGTDYVLAFDRQRFLPQRPQSLHRLQWVAGTLFEAAAQEDLIDPARLRGDKAERDAQIAELRAWCKRNAGVTTAARLATRLDKENDFAKWRELFWSLNRVDAVAAADAAVRLARRQPERVARVAQLLVLLDRREHVGDARVWLAEDDAELRLWAALLVVAAKSDKDGASIGIALAHLATAPTATVHAAVPALFASERPEARSFLVECLKGKRAGFEPSFAFAGELLRRGVPEAFDVLDAALAKPAECTLREFGEPVREPGRGAVLVARWFPVEDGAREETPEDEAKFAAQVREQLRKEWDTIRAGEPPTMQVGGLELDWGDWVDRRGSGWVRRF